VQTINVRQEGDVIHASRKETDSVQRDRIWSQLRRRWQIAYKFGHLPSTRRSRSA
jgi:hypothetical protein